MEKIDLKSVKIALNRDEMEEIVGGCWGCVWSSVGLAASIAGFAFVTGGIGLGVALVGYSASVGGVVTSC